MIALTAAATDLPIEGCGNELSGVEALEGLKGGRGYVAISTGRLVVLIIAALK